MKKPVNNKDKEESKRKGKNARDNLNKKKKTHTTNSEYQKYLKSKEWSETRQWFFENIYKKMCYFCSRTEEDGAIINLHHNQYVYLHKEKEHPECLIPMCASCHRHLHLLRSNWGRFKKEDNVKDDKEDV